MKATVELEQVKLSYEDHGGEGAPIVLLHGFCCGSDSWERVVPLLSPRYRVIVPDLRGHGQSSYPGGALCSMEELAEDICQLLDALNIEQISLFGHSMGGYVSLAFAEKYAHRLNRLALIHSTGLADTEQGREARLNNIRTIEEQGFDLFLEGFVSRFFAADAAGSETDGPLTQRALAIAKQTDPSAAKSCLRGMRERPDRNPVISKLQVPVLLVGGDQDAIIPKERTFSVEGWHSRQIELKGCGHSSMVEQTEMLVSVMIEFLKE